MSAGEQPRLSQAWREWLAENLLLGAESEELVAALVDEGVPASLASQELDALVASPLLTAGRRLVARSRKLHRLRSTLEDQEIPRISADMSAERFNQQHLRANRPALVPGAARTWEAMEWTFPALAERFGSEQVRVFADRDGDPEHPWRFDAHQVSMGFDEFVQRVLQGPTNDLYMVSRNRNLRRGVLRPLVDELGPLPEWMSPEDLGRSASLWLGPAGTLTRLHHDQCNILFVQLHGRKRVTLCSPAEADLLDGVRGFYADVPAPLPVSDGPRAHVVELEPGDGLFIPVGWWHQVEALRPSISVSLTRFRQQSDFGWYRLE